MICRKCGLENPDENRFCEKCGEPLSGTEKTKLEESPGRHKKIAIIITLAIIAACVIGIFVFFGGNKEAEYNEMIDTADLYLQDADYEKAEDAYLEAINISPKEESAYMKLADLYLSQGQYEDAVDIMATGERKIGSRASGTFNSKLEKVRTDSMYGAYYELCLEYQEKYGAGRFSEYDFQPEFGDLTGMSVAQLIDFNDDGVEELLVVYKDGMEFGVADRVKCEVWTWQDNELVNVLPPTGISTGTDVSGQLRTRRIDGTLYMSRSWVKEMLYSEHLYYDGNVFKTKYEAHANIWEDPELESAYFKEGEEVSEVEYQDMMNKVETEVPYSRETPYFNENGELYIEFISIESSYADQVLAETNKTLELLKPHVTVTTASAEAYRGIIEMYRKMVRDGENMDWDNLKEVYGADVNLEAMSALSSEYWDKAYYTLKDIDKNGVNELIIACGADITSRDESNFYEFYTLKDGVPAKYFPDKLFGYRTNFGVYKDGTIWVLGTGSAWDSTFEYYSISDDGYSVDSIESIASVSGEDYGNGDREVLFYHDKDTREEITERQFDEIRDRYESKEDMKFDWQRIQ